MLTLSFPVDHIAKVKTDVWYFLVKNWCFFVSDHHTSYDSLVRCHISPGWWFVPTVAIFRCEVRVSQWRPLGLWVKWSIKSLCRKSSFISGSLTFRGHQMRPPRLRLQSQNPLVNALIRPLSLSLPTHGVKSRITLGCSQLLFWASLLPKIMTFMGSLSKGSLA